jgi:phage FluMu gp28-like protein
VTTWGGQLCLISTHRGAQTIFNQLVRDVTERGNPMGWSLHTVPLQKAVDQGLVEKINEKARRAAIPSPGGGGQGEGGTSSQPETRAAFLKRLRAGCLDEEQWLQEYCCVPADESVAFITYEMLAGCEDAEARLLGLGDLEGWLNGKDGKNGTYGGGPLYVGVDVARKHDLCVIDVGERIGDIVWDRARIEFQGRPFSEIEAELYRLLRLRQVKRACIDATGMGIQLAERAVDKFNWKVEPITFTAAVKEELAFGLRSDFEDRKLRIPRDEKLRADLRGIQKEVSLSGNIRFVGESGDSHCDRFWAKALRQHAARYKVEVGGGIA